MYVYDLADGQGVGGHEGRHGEEDARPGRVRRPGRDGPLHRLLVVAGLASSSPTRKPTTPASSRGTSPTRSSRSRSRRAAVLPAAGQEERGGAARHRCRSRAAKRSGSSGTAKKYEYLAAVRGTKHGPLTISGAGPHAAGAGAAARSIRRRARRRKLLDEKDPAWVNLRQDVPRSRAALGGFTGSVLAAATANGETSRRSTPRMPTACSIQCDAGASDAPETMLERRIRTRFDTFSRLRGVSTDPTQRHDLPTSDTPACNVNSGSDEGRVALDDRSRAVHTGVVRKNGGSLRHHVHHARRRCRKSVVFTRAKRNARRVALRRGRAAVHAERDESSKVGEAVTTTAIVRPRNFDPKKKYPVIVDVYGGPQHLHVVQAMRNWLLPQWLADQGFIVVAIDNRGTPGRGRDWERAIYQKFGTVPLEDQVEGLQALGEKFPEMDLDRVGIVGWSFGGYMSARRAAAAGRLQGGRRRRPGHRLGRLRHALHRALPGPACPRVEAGLRRASLFPLAKDLKRPLLLVHGTADDNVYFRHTLKLTDALFRAGKDFEVLPLSGLTHMSPTRW